MDKKNKPDNASVVFPIATKAMATTVALDLVSVLNGFAAQRKLRRNKIITEVKAINRDRKIKSVLEDKPFEEMKIQEHPEWKISPTILDSILKSNVTFPDQDKLIVGNDSKDDAAAHITGKTRRTGKRRV